MTGTLATALSAFFSPSPPARDDQVHQPLLGRQLPELLAAAAGKQRHRGRAATRSPPATPPPARPAPRSRSRPRSTRAAPPRCRSSGRARPRRSSRSAAPRRRSRSRPAAPAASAPAARSPASSSRRSRPPGPPARRSRAPPSAISAIRVLGQRQAVDQRLGQPLLAPGLDVRRVRLQQLRRPAPRSGRRGRAGRRPWRPCRSAPAGAKPPSPRRIRRERSERSWPRPKVTRRNRPHSRVRLVGSSRARGPRSSPPGRPVPSILAAPAAAAPTAGALHGRGAEPPPLAEAAGPDARRLPLRLDPPRLPLRPHQVPFERADPSLGTTRIGFAVRPRDDRSRPSRGTIFAVEGGPGYSSTGSAKYYTRLLPRPPAPPRAGARRHPRHRHLGRPPLRRLPEAEDPPAGGRQPLRRTARPPVLLLPHPGRRRGHRVGPPGARPRRHPPLRRLLRHLPRPDLRVPSRRPHPPAGPRRLLPDRRRESLVRERTPHRHARPHPRLQPLPRMPPRIPQPPDPGGGQDAPGGRRRRRPSSTRSGAPAATAPPRPTSPIDRAIRRYLDGAPNPFPGGFEKGGTGGLRAFSRAMEVVFSCNDYPLLWKKEAPQADRRHPAEAGGPRLPAPPLLPVHRRRDQQLHLHRLPLLPRTRPRPAPSTSLRAHPASGARRRPDPRDQR